MGLLDPKLDKARTLELLRKRGAVKAELKFQGGHDEGDVEEIILTLDDGETVNLDTWYCGGYGYGPNGYEPLTRRRTKTRSSLICSKDRSTSASVPGTACPPPTEPSPGTSVGKRSRSTTPRRSSTSSTRG